MKKEKKAEKAVRLYRVLIGGKLAAISFEFDEKGVAVKADDATKPAIFSRELMASKLIERTLNARSKARESLISDYKGFKPIMHSMPFEVQPFEAHEEDAP